RALARIATPPDGTEGKTVEVYAEGQVELTDRLGQRQKQGRKTLVASGVRLKPYTPQGLIRLKAPPPRSTFLERAFPTPANGPPPPPPRPPVAVIEGPKAGTPAAPARTATDDAPPKKDPAVRRAQFAPDDAMPVGPILTPPEPDQAPAPFAPPARDVP